MTVFADRIEVTSPGSLPNGVELESLRIGRAAPKWRNQALAWFFSRLQIAQAEGQGIPTILRSMRDEGCPPPVFEADNLRVVCTLPAHPRHAVLRDLRSAEQSLALGELEQARTRIEGVLQKDPLNSRALQLFAEVNHALGDTESIAAWAQRHLEQLSAMPSEVLVQLAEALEAEPSSSTQRDLAAKLLAAAARGRLEERQLRRIAVAMSRANDDQGGLALIERHLIEHPEWERNPSLRQLRGDALIGLAKRCRATAKKTGIASATRARAWKEFHSYLDRAERELRDALALSVNAGLTEQVQRNIDYLLELRRDNQPPRRGRRR